MKVNLIAKKAIITTSIKMETLKQLEKLRPDALKLKDKDGNELFSVCTSTVDSISKFGACFASLDKDGNAILILDCEDIAKGQTVTKDELVNAYALAMTQLQKVERQVIDESRTVNAELEALKASVTLGFEEEAEVMFERIPEE